MKQGSVELLLGRSGTGKTQWCLEAFREEIEKSDKGLNSSSFFLVPTKEHADRITTLLMGKACSASIFNLNVMTFNQFADQVIRQNLPAGSITPFYKLLLIQRQLDKVALKYYQTLPGVEVFITSLSSLIANMKELLVTPAKLRRTLSSFSEEALQLKLEDICTIYEQYEKALEQEHIQDDEGRVLSFCELKSMPTYFQYQSIYLDGFFDFSVSQLNFLKKISHFTENLYLTLTLDSKEINTERFALAGKTKQQIEKLFPNLTERSFSEVHRDYGHQIKQLEEGLFNRQVIAKEEHQDKEENIRIFKARHRFDEVKLLAGEIRALLLQGYNYSDICILFRNIDPYLTELEQQFDRFDIPVEIHERRELYRHPSMKKIQLFLNMFIQEFSFVSTLEYLRSVLEGRDYQEFCQLERQFQQEAVGDQYESFWDAYEQESGLSKFKKVIEPLKALEQELTKLIRAQDFASELKKRFIDRGEVYAITKESGKKESLVPFDRLNELFDELEDYYVGEVSYTEYFETLYHLIQVSLYSISNPNQNSVQIYNVSNAKQKEYKVVLLAGMLEDTFPQKIYEDLLLKDEEREVLQQLGIEMPLIRDRIASEKYLFYTACTRATEKLYFSFPGYDHEGKELLKSSYLDEVIEVLESHVVVEDRSETIFQGNYNDIYLEEEMKQRILYDRFHGAFQSWQNNFFEDLSGEEFVEEKNLGVQLSPEAILQYQSEIRRPFSASRLEKFIQCPYKYFIEEMVDIEPFDELFDVRIQGTLIHKVLERFYQETLADITDKAEWLLLKDLEQSLYRVNELFDEEVEKLELPKHLPEIQSQLINLRELLEDFLKNEQEIEKERNTLPQLFEYAFGLDSGEGALDIEFKGGEKHSFCGVIDRVDVLPNQEAALVVDYKGTKTIKTKEFEEGREVQLFLYLKFIREKLGKKVIGVELYPVKKMNRSGIYVEEMVEHLGGVIRKNRVYQEKQLQQFEENFEGRVLDAIDRLESGEIEVKPETCDFCKLNSICRFEQWQLKLGNQLDD